MKLIVENVHYGLVPYGPGTGNRAIGITFKEADGDYTYEAEKDENGNPVTSDPVLIAAAGLLKDILDEVKKQELELPWSNYLLGREYLYFIGTETAKTDHRTVIAALLEGLSKMGLEVQKKAFESIAPEDKLGAVKKQLHAPMPVWVGEPSYYTGRDTFYENFNLVLLKLPLSEDAKFNQMTMVEVANHAFSTYILEMDKANFETQKKVLQEKYKSLDALALPPQRIFIVDKDGDNDIAQFALDEGYRINRKMNYDTKFILDI